MKELKTLLYGGDYNFEQWLDRPEILEEDIQLMKKANINEATLGVFSWSLWEKEEGVYDFTPLDNIMDKLNSAGIKVILATPSGARPAWIAKKYPEVLRVNENGIRNGFGMRHNHCFTSPIYREKSKAIAEQLALRYKDHPALIMWHISNELGGECYCPLCQDAFREFLKKKYKTLENLNKAWYTTFWSHTYTSWEEIEAPSKKGEQLVHCQNLDWKRFITDQTISFLKNETEPLRRLTPEIPITTNFMYHFKGLDYYHLSKELDYVSWDNYPAWNNKDGNVKVAMDTAMYHDIVRSFKKDKPFLMMESSPSATNWQGVARLRDPGILTLQGLQAIAHGSDSIQYFQWRASRGASEKFHGACISHDGRSDTRVFKEVSEIGKELTGIEKLAGSRKKSKVAIIYDMENIWALEDLRGYKDNKKFKEALLSFYRPLWERGISVDFLNEEEELEGYRLVLAPMLYLLKPDFAKKTENYVKAGGTFVTTYISGVVDESDLCFTTGAPGPLQDLLGLSVEETDSLDDNVTRECSIGNDKYILKDFLDIVRLEGSLSLGEYTSGFYKGRAVLCVNNYGKGKSYYLAARSSEGILEGKLVSSILKEINLSSPISDDIPEGISIQVREDEEKEYAFIMNFTPETKEIKVMDPQWTNFKREKHEVIQLAPYSHLLLNKSK